MFVLTFKNAMGVPIILHDFKSQQTTLVQQVSDKAQLAFDRHQWYLRPEMVLLGLFSDLVSDKEKRDLLAAARNKEEPTYPINNLHDAACKRSMAMFDTLAVNQEDRGLSG